MKIGYFIANSPHYLPSVIPLINETGGMLITFNRRTERFIDGLKKKYSIVYYRNYKRLLQYMHDLSIDILVHPGFSIQYFKRIDNIKHVQVFHGTSDKPFNFHKSLGKYDLITVPGYKMKEDITKRGLADPAHIAVTGYPKIDYFLHSGFDPDAFMKKIGIDPSRKTILYSPTWDDPDKYSSFAMYIIPILRNLNAFNVIIKPHPNILKYRPWQILKAYIMKKGNCSIFHKSTSILPFMEISDIMLTDISSVSHEYLPFDKPMVFLHPRPNDAIPAEHTWVWRCGDIVEDTKEILPVIMDNLHNPLKYKLQREKALRDIFLKFDGQSSKRFKDALIKLVH